MLYVQITCPFMFIFCCWSCLQPYCTQNGENSVEFWAFLSAFRLTLFSSLQQFYFFPLLSKCTVQENVQASPLKQHIFALFAELQPYTWLFCIFLNFSVIDCACLCLTVVLHVFALFLFPVCFMCFQFLCMILLLFLP